MYVITENEITGLNYVKEGFWGLRREAKEFATADDAIAELNEFDEGEIIETKKDGDNVIVKIQYERNVVKTLDIEKI